mmetsp:Transcript_20056/g.44643  ORF Transcript_20056/g.44643 Transcript_20056/m.44643 type:complete len:219 (-) Transcript_20056:919-1575(-)
MKIILRFQPLPLNLFHLPFEDFPLPLSGRRTTLRGLHLGLGLPLQGVLPRLDLPPVLLENPHLFLQICDFPLLGGLERLDLSLMPLEHCRLLVRRLGIQALQPLALGIRPSPLLVPLQNHRRQFFLLMVQGRAHVIALLGQSLVFPFHAVQQGENVLHFCLGGFTVHGGDPELLREIADVPLQLGDPLPILFVTPGHLLQSSLELTLVKLGLGAPIFK